MGSSASRKTNDRPVINRPKTTGTGIGVGGADSGSQSVDINNICPLAFNVKLSDQTVAVGTKLTLDDRQLKTATGTVAGRLTPAQHKIVQRCNSLGYLYNDVEVVDKKDVRYAEIRR